MVVFGYEYLHMLRLSFLEILHLNLPLRDCVRSQLPNVKLERRVVVRFAVVVLVAVQNIANSQPFI